MEDAVNRDTALDIQCSAAEVELLHRVAAALGWTVADLCLSGAVAAAADISTRWSADRLDRTAAAAIEAYDRLLLERGERADSGILALVAGAVEQTNTERTIRTEARAGYVSSSPW